MIPLAGIGRAQVADRRVALLDTDFKDKSCVAEGTVRNEKL